MDPVSDRYILGAEICRACGHVDTVSVASLDYMGPGACRDLTEPSVCDACGAEAALVDVWHSTEYWPEVDRIVRFDRERQRLRLPPMSNIRH